LLVGRFGDRLGDVEGNGVSVALDSLRFVAVFAIGIAAGTLVALLVGVTPTLRRLEPGEALRTKQMVERLLDRYQPALVAIALVTSAATLFWHLSTSAYVLTGIGLGANVGVAVLALGFCLPVNRQLESLEASPNAAEFSGLLARWSRFHVLRTVAALIAFASYLLAVVVD
jgi:uncharacterized membrane protein